MSKTTSMNLIVHHLPDCNGDMVPCIYIDSATNLIVHACEPVASTYYSNEPLTPHMFLAKTINHLGYKIRRNLETNKDDYNYQIMDELLSIKPFNEIWRSILDEVTLKFQADDMVYTSKKGQLKVNYWKATDEVVYEVAYGPLCAINGKRNTTKAYRKFIKFSSDQSNGIREWLLEEEVNHMSDIALDPQINAAKNFTKALTAFKKAMRCIAPTGIIMVGDRAYRI